MTEKVDRNGGASRSILAICAFALVVIIAAAGVIMAASASVSDLTAIDRGDVASFNNGWVSSFSGNALKLPYAYGGGTVDLTNTVPQLDRDSVIYINTDYAPVTAAIGGESAKVTGSFSEGSYGVDGGSQWVSVELPAEASGQELTLTFYNSGSKASIEVYRVLIGSPEAIELLLLCNDLDDAAIAAVMAAGAIFMAGAAIFCGVKRRGHAAEAAYVAAFCAFLALWIYAGSDLPAVFARGSRAVTLIWLLAPMLSCIPPALIVRDRSVKLRIALTALVGAQAAAVAAVAILPLLGISDLTLFTNISHIVIAVTALALVAATLIERLAGNAYMTLPLAAAVIAAVGIVIAALSFYTRTSADDTLALRLLLPVAATLLAVNALKLPRHADIFLPLEFAELPEELSEAVIEEDEAADDLPAAPEYVLAEEEAVAEPVTETVIEPEPIAVEPEPEPAPLSEAPRSSFALAVEPLLLHRNSLHVLCRLRIDGISRMDAQAAAELTSRLKRALHPGDVIARSDEGFELLLADAVSPVVARRRAKAALAAANKRALGVKPMAALGAAIFPADGVSYDELYACAQAALVYAQTASDRLAFYMPGSERK